METIPLHVVPIAGAVDRDRTADGVVLRRSPVALRHQLDAGLRTLVEMSAGIRIELLTDARAIELDVLVTVLDVGEVMSLPAVFDLVVAGSRRSSATAGSGNRLVVDPTTRATHLVRGNATTIRSTTAPAIRVSASRSGSPIAASSNSAPCGSAMVHRGVRWRRDGDGCTMAARSVTASRSTIRPTPGRRYRLASPTSTW